METTDVPQPEQGFPVKETDLESITPLTPAQVIDLLGTYKYSLRISEKLIRKSIAGVQLSPEDELRMAENSGVTSVAEKVLRILGQGRLVDRLYNEVMLSFPEDD